MGNYLESPRTEKNTERHGSNVGISSMQGWRISMEDTHIATNMPNADDHTLFAVFDGHGGVRAANFVAASFTKQLTESREWDEYLATRSEPLLRQAFTQCFVELDNQMRLDETIGESGCTATVVMITPTFIICANAGDSRAVMSQGRTVIELSRDHKPENPEEKQRIEQNRGHVQNNRVNGMLAVSRAFGDFDLKLYGQPLVSVLPEFVTHIRDYHQDEMIIIACDGLWDVFSNEEAIKEVCQMIWNEGETDMSLVAEEMLDLSIQKGSKDNVSAIIIKLSSSLGGGGGGGGVALRRQLREQEQENHKKNNGIK
jgi:serine/threonine protein phosphatase PrpC